MEPAGAAAPGTAALVEGFRHRPVIVLSPHFDDACFSLGGFLKTLGHGILINLFTHGRYVVQPRLARADLTQDAVRYVRDKEDRAFASACGLVRRDLECEEPALRRRRPSEMAGLADDVRQIEDRLLALLFALAAESGTPSKLFVPLGIGRHVNHRAATETILRNLARLQPFFESISMKSCLTHRTSFIGWRRWSGFAIVREGPPPCLHRAMAREARPDRPLSKSAARHAVIFPLPPGRLPIGRA